MNKKLGLHIKPTLFKGDIHLSELEKSWMSQVHEITGEDTPFWIIVAGGKRDFTIKWWEFRRFQEVVDHFRGKILFVQVGEKPSPQSSVLSPQSSVSHHHPPLNGVLDLRGKTDLRQFVRLMYHAQGVLCPVTFAMHLAAAVEVKGGFPKNRPCVVVAGGREPAHWEAYPHHQYLHTCGALPCCDNGGCWKSRSTPLGDGDDKDKPDNLCLRAPQGLPACMDLIKPQHVIQAIERYYDGGVLQYQPGAVRRAQEILRVADAETPEPAVAGVT